MARFFIRVLGAWRIETTLWTDVTSLVERGVLLMLATARARGVPSKGLDMLSAALGPTKADLVDPNNALYHALCDLRAKLCDTEHAILTRDSNTRRYRLAVEPDEVDYLTFVHHFDAAQDLLAGTTPSDGQMTAALDHQVAGLQLWNSHWGQGLPEHATIRQTVAEMDAMRQLLLRQYVNTVTALDARYCYTVPLRSLTEVLLLDVTSLSPLHLADLLKRCDYDAAADLVDTLLTTPHPHAAKLFTMLNQAHHLRV